MRGDPINAITFFTIPPPKFVGERAVFVAEKGLLSAVAALRDVVGNAWSYDAGDASHGGE